MMKRRRRRALKIGVEIAMAKKDTMKERRQELRAVSPAAAHPHLWMQEIIQRVFLDGRNHPKVLCRCRKSSKSYFLDGGKRGKVISRWRKSSKGYF
jgi:CDGSH-type Zn-finger protein